MKICWVLDHHHHKKNLSTYLQTFIKVSANHDLTFVESMMAMGSSSFFFWAKSIKRVCAVGGEDKWLWKTTKTLTSVHIYMTFNLWKPDIISTHNHVQGEFAKSKDSLLDCVFLTSWSVDSSVLYAVAAALEEVVVVVVSVFLSCCICCIVHSKCAHCTCTTVCCPTHGEPLDGGEEDMSMSLLPLGNEPLLMPSTAVIVIAAPGEIMSPLLMPSTVVVFAAPKLLGWQNLEETWSSEL